MKKLILTALVCLGLSAQVLACGCGGAAPRLNNNTRTTTPKTVAR